MIDDFGREDRREEDEGQLVAGLREDIEAEEGRLSDTNQDTWCRIPNSYSRRRGRLSSCYCKRNGSDEDNRIVSI